MSYRVLKGLLAFVVILTITTTNVTADNPSIYIKNEYYRMNLRIDNAYYLDADGDDDEDDVIAELTLYTVRADDDDYYYSSSYSNSYSYYKWDCSKEFDIDVKYKFVLVLPSGIYFEHYFEREVTQTETSYQLTLMNHALEQGDYDLYTIIRVTDGGWMRGTAWLTFDPPGGQGGDPYAILV